jgi:hypothetical protein
VQAVSPGLTKDLCGRVYLDLTLKSDQKLMEGLKLVVKFIADDVKAFCHGYSTTFSESMHNKRMRLTNKRKNYTDFDGRSVEGSAEINWGLTRAVKSSFTELKVTPPGAGLSELEKMEARGTRRAAQKSDKDYRHAEAKRRDHNKLVGTLEQKIDEAIGDAYVCVIEILQTYISALLDIICL